MPIRTASPLNEDFRLAMALEDQRPDAADQVYDVYGPELVEYAEGLVGDHDAAVEAVHAALLALSAKGAGAGTFRDRMYELVREECQDPPVRLHRWLVVIGVAAGVVLTAVMLVLFESTDGDETSPVAAPPRVTMTSPAAPSPSPTPSREKKKAKVPAKDDKPAKTPAGPGRLSVDDAGCRGVRAVGLPTRCEIRLTARGGAVKWSVSSVRSGDARISADGSGKLAAGRSASVAVTVRPRVLCFLDGSGSGTVSFAPGGTATVTYTCWKR
ncbi:hypothetical protein [Spirillospora sp. NPDC048824]|uniref:hypothetical protein n=1 Tax=Spirillospora sp. NPDC048824 TaxID=3364526 RepID=UPI003722CEC6